VPRAAVFLCSENFGEFLQDSISVVLVLDGKFAFAQDRIQIEINFGGAVAQK